mgnify:CR=1 FL=1
MTDRLTREQIEALREDGKCVPPDLTPRNIDDLCDLALASLERWEGQVMVPREHTAAMMEAFYREWEKGEWQEDDWTAVFTRAYRAMLAATASPDQSEIQDDVERYETTVDRPVPISTDKFMGKVLAGADVDLESGVEIAGYVPAVPASPDQREKEK